MTCFSSLVCVCVCVCTVLCACCLLLVSIALFPFCRFLSSLFPNFGPFFSLINNKLSAHTLDCIARCPYRIDLVSIGREREKKTSTKVSNVLCIIRKTLWCMHTTHAEQNKRPKKRHSTGLSASRQTTSVIPCCMHAASRNIQMMYMYTYDVRTVWKSQENEWRRYSTSRGTGRCATNV